MQSASVSPFTRVLNIRNLTKANFPFTRRSSSSLCSFISSSTFISEVCKSANSCANVAACVSSSAIRRWLASITVRRLSLRFTSSSSAVMLRLVTLLSVTTVCPPAFALYSCESFAISSASSFHAGMSSPFMPLISALGVLANSAFSALIFALAALASCCLCCSICAKRASDSAIRFCAAAMSLLSFTPSASILSNLSSRCCSKRTFATSLSCRYCAAAAVSRQMVR